MHVFLFITSSSYIVELTANETGIQFWIKMGVTKTNMTNLYLGRFL